MKFWLVTGSQHLYGKETLDKVAENVKIMTEKMNQSGIMQYPIVPAGVVTTPAEITDVMTRANNDTECGGVITFMHTFSPSKMWIDGLMKLQKPYCHFHTQFGREIPFDTIDMDFMNLYQSAHGDREHGYIGARLRMPRKVVVGYWQDKEVQQELAGFMAAAAGYRASRKMKVARFGDNMRYVAVTEGDKIQAQINYGWDVSYYPLGDLCKEMEAVTDADVDRRFDEVTSVYTLATDNIESVKYQLKTEIALRRFLERGNFGAFTTDFEDLYGLRQLPGLACQLLMADGYGFAGEGDWKTAALTGIVKSMSVGRKGGTAFMEDYTYHMPESGAMVLGAHMLEVCPSIAATKPEIKVCPLGIGGKEPPARLIFDGSEGEAVCVSLIDIGGRMRMITQDVICQAPIRKMPNLPVASVMWKPLPDLRTAAKAWILAGGAHHTVLSFAVNAGIMSDFAEMTGTEIIRIGKNTDIDELKKELRWNDIYYRLKN